jgi:hypothetical protein
MSLRETAQALLKDYDSIELEEGCYKVVWPEMEALRKALAKKETSEAEPEPTVQRESVNDALSVVESYGPWGADINDSHRRQIVLAEEVLRLRHIYELAVRGRAEMREALRREREVKKAEPVAWLLEIGELGSVTNNRYQAQDVEKSGGKVTPLYAYPPAALPEFSDEEIINLWTADDVPMKIILDFARAILAAARGKP